MMATQFELEKQASKTEPKLVLVSLVFCCEVTLRQTLVVEKEPHYVSKMVR